MIDIGDCFGDSPRFRQSVLCADRHLGRFESALKALCKSLKISLETAQQLAQANMNVAENLAEVGKAERLSLTSSSGNDSDNSRFELADALQQLAQELMVVELNRKQLAYELEKDVVDTLDTFWRGDLSCLKELKRRWEKNCLEFSHSNAKYMAKKAKDPGLFEAAQEVADARKDYHSASLDFTIRLNELLEKRCVKVYGSLAVLINSLKTFVLKQEEAAKELQNPYQTMLNASKASEECLEGLVQTMQERKHRIIINTEPIYNPLVIDRTPTPAPSPSSESPSEVESEEEEHPIKEGYMYKKSSHAMRPVWSRRYFMLYPNRLEYYSMQEGNSPVPIDLRLCAVKPSSDSERRFCFDLVSPIKTFTIQAESETEMDQWMERLTEAIQSAISSLSRTGTIPAGTSSERHASIDSVLEEHRLERPINEDEMTIIKGLSGNDRCAECGENDPKWASVNNGILLCIACSGVHRGLGAQISKVRSLELDYWEPAQISLMQCLGNAAINAILEFGYDDNKKLYYTKPSPDSEQTTREQWVTAKYELGKFVQESTVEESNRNLWMGLKGGKHLDVYAALHQGANPDEEKGGDNALIYALRQDQYAMALLFLYSNADVNMSDPQDFSTPLHILAKKSDQDSYCMLLCLLKRHASLEAQDSQGRTALDVAVASSNAAAATVLRIAALAEELDDVRVVESAEVPPSHNDHHQRLRRSKKLIKKITQHINK